MNSWRVTFKDMLPDLILYSIAEYVHNVLFGTKLSYAAIIGLGK